MKKLIMLMLCLSILCLNCTALAENGEIIIGAVESIGDDVGMFYTSAFEHLEKEHGVTPIVYTVKGYPNLNAVLLDLYAGRVHILSTAEFCAQYIASRNEGLVLNAPNITSYIGYSMMTMEEDVEIYNLLNDAIIELKENGTIEALKQEHITKCCEGEEPAAITLPVIEGAETISVAITGDIPPMDYISAEGAPAGFNLALLAEISKLAQVNIEVVPMEALARATALAGGKVDAIFWVNNLFCDDETHDFHKSESAPDTLNTEIYIEAPIISVVKMP